MERLLTIAEVCAKLQVKESCLRAWLHQRKISSIRVGRLVRFHERDIERFLKQGEVEEDRHDLS